MSLHPQEIPPIPEETRRVARAAFPRGNVYMRLRDELGTIYEDHLFTTLFPARGQPAEPPWRLALTTVIQFTEGLSDRQAADAVRSRIDWKYALSLELTVFAIVYNLVRAVMWHSARLQQIGVERISFLDALRWLSAPSTGIPLGALIVNPIRPHRVEPRVKKRRPKSFPLMLKPRQALRRQLVQQALGG